MVNMGGFRNVQAARQAEDGQALGAPEQPVPVAEQPQLGAELAAIGERLAALEAQLAAQREQLAAQQEERTQLHADLQEARRDQVALLLTPGVKQLLVLRGWLEDAPQDNPHLAHAKELLADAIEAFGFEEIAPEPGEAFDKKLHKSVNVTETEDEGLDGTIASLITPGFTYANAKRAAFPAAVVVRKYAR